jgi:RNA polymerase sigma factor (sigma-70 family)
MVANIGGAAGKIEGQIVMKTKVSVGESLGDNWQLVLVKGNAIAKTHARRILGRRKLGRFLRVFNNPGCAASIKVKPAQVEEILNLPHEDRLAICESQEISQRVCLQFEKLAIRIANRYAVGVGKDSDADILQLESEAKVGLIKAIKAYSNAEIKFITYAHKTVSNEVSRYLQRGMGSTLSGTNNNLLVRYKKKREELSKASQPCSLEDVCLELELSPGQTSRLKDAIRAEVSHESDMDDALAKILTDPRKDTSVDCEFIKELEAVNLTKLEKFAFISQNDDIRAMFPDAFPSLKAVAAHFGVTPQAASEALKRARKKLSKALVQFRPY